MKRLFVTMTVALLATLSALGQTNTSTIYQYTPGDGGILYSVTHGNRWAIINLGTSASGGTAVSQLFDMETGEHFPVTYQGHALPFRMASDDGNIIVGNYGEYAISYNRATGQIHSYPNRPLWKNGQLEDCTPDGRYAVGYYQGYVGKPDGGDLPNDWFYRTLFVDTQTGDTLYTPNLPTRNRGGGRLQSIKFTNITPDGRYIMGAVDWYFDGGYNFIYDVEARRTLSNTDLMRLYGGDVAAKANARGGRGYTVQSCSGNMMSPSGASIGGTARIRTASGESKSAPCVYFIAADSLAVYDHAEDGGVSIYAMDDAGTFFGCNETGTPLRSMKILYGGKYWVTLNQICRQRFGYDFFERTGYERTGTVMGVSADGHRFISFHDPMGESYCFDFGMTVEEACSTLDLLSNYTVTPESGASFSLFNSVEIRFERPVQILGNGRSVHLYDSAGRLVADGLSSSSGLTLKTGSSTTVVANFRSRLLADGESYTVVLDSGAVATSVDRQCVNATIRIPYQGRANGPVALTATAPADGSSLARLDNISSYMLLTFDCPIALTDSAFAYVERCEDGSRAATLHMVAGTEPETRRQVLMYPQSTVIMLQDRDYRIIVAPGSITDVTHNAASGNDTISILYHGTYVRTVPTGDVLFADSWDDIAESLQLWLRYDGDHLTPMASMQALEFDADNQPWNFSIRESETSYDYCAGSHSMYAPSGRSDDWMMTPQVTLPADGRCMLEFDAQSYYHSRSDTLEVYVWPQEWTLGYLNAEWMEEVRDSAVLVFKEVLSPGETQELLAGEWTHYTVDLTPWAGRDVYVAFVNHNRNQSAIFIDNVIIQREVFYTLAFKNEERVVALDNLPISGQITPRHDVDAIRLVLRDGDGTAVDSIVWQTAGSSIAGRALPFTFTRPLPLRKGYDNPFQLDITVGDHAGTYSGTITDLLFLPTRRVALEEMTGIDCPNCPLGIAAIERMKGAFGDRILPISIHSYTGDPYESGLTGYTTFLGLIGAPSARIDRTRGIYYPMATVDGRLQWSNPLDPLWYDIVSEELDRPALCDLALDAVRTPDGTAEYTVTVTPAVHADDQQLALLVVVLEDSLVNYQLNGYGSMTDGALGEWGVDGVFSGRENGEYVYPYQHDDVARAVVGNSVAGTIGLYPTALQAGESYAATIRSSFPTIVVNASQAHAVALLIDSHTGEVLNAAAAPFRTVATGMEAHPADDRLSSFGEGTGCYYDLQGRAVAQPQQGIYIVNGRKVLVR